MVNNYGIIPGTAISDITKSPFGVEASYKDSKSALRLANGKSFWTYRLWENNKYFATESKIRQFINGDSGIKDPWQASNEGLAYAFREYTTLINHQSFATSFDTGSGSQYNIYGIKVNDPYLSGGYSNMALQDLLPTWKFIIDVMKADGTIDQSRVGNTGVDVMHIASPDAWMGSSVIAYTGNVDGNQTIINKLFTSEITLKNKDTFEFMYKGATKPSLAVLTYENNAATKNIIEGEVDSKSYANGYKKITFDVSSLQGKLMSSFGVAFKNSSKDQMSLNFKLGKIAFVASDYKQLNELAFNEVYYDGEWLTTSGKHLRIRWKLPKNEISKYLVYLTDKDFNNSKLINITTNNGVDLHNLPMKSEKTYLEIIPVNKMGKLMKPVKVIVNGTKLDLSDTSKYSIKSHSKTDLYGVETGHGYVGKTSDRHGGAYLVNDLVNVYYIDVNGVLHTDGNYGVTVFEGKPKSGRHHGEDGKTFASIYVDSQNRIFIAKRESGTGLYVYEKGMARTKNANLLALRNNPIFSEANEYVAKMFETSDGFIYAVSAFGNIKRLNSNGIVDKNYSARITGKQGIDEYEIKLIKLGDEVILQATNSGRTFSDKFGKTLEPKNKYNFGLILTTQKVGNKLLVASSKSNSLFISEVDTIAKTVIYSKNVNDTKGGKDVNITPEYFRTLTFSKDGKYLYMRDIHFKSRFQPWAKGYVRESSYVYVLDITNINADNASVKGYGAQTANAVSYDGQHKYGGNFIQMITLGNGDVVFMTSDWGRVGVFEFDVAKEKVSIRNMTLVIYQFELPSGKKVEMKKVVSFLKSGWATKPE